MICFIGFLTFRGTGHKPALGWEYRGNSCSFRDRMPPAFHARRLHFRRPNRVGSDWREARSSADGRRCSHPAFRDTLRSVSRTDARPVRAARRNCADADSKPDHRYGTTGSSRHCSGHDTDCSDSLLPPKLPRRDGSTIPQRDRVEAASLVAYGRWRSRWKLCAGCDRPCSRT